MEGCIMKYKLVATAIICNDDKYLITKRSMSEEKFPGYWTVPGGTVDKEDHTIPNEDGLMYNIIEKSLAREIKEEVGLNYTNLRYVVSLAYPKSNDFAMCLSFAVDYIGGEVVLQEEELTDYAWVTFDELDKYKLVIGIKEEIAVVEKERLKNLKNKNKQEKKK